MYREGTAKMLTSLFGFIGIIGFLALCTSVFILAVQIQSADFMSKERRNKFLLILQKPKETRLEEEQKIIDTTWPQYYLSKIRIISFKTGIILFPIGLLLNYITST